MHDEGKRKKIIENEEKIRKLESEQNRLRKELRGSCDHASVVVSDYQPETFIYNYAPEILVCAECGLREDGWSKDKLIAAPVRKVSRDKISEYYKLIPLKSVLVPEDK